METLRDIIKSNTIEFLFPEAYLQTCQTSKLERFAKIVKVKHSVLHVWIHLWFYTEEDCINFVVNLHFE